MSDQALHSPSETRIAVPFLVFSALLLVFLIPDVILRKPSMAPEIRQSWVMHHQATENFLLAQKFVASRLGSPVESWTSGFDCGEVGRGVWFAQGNVEPVTTTTKDAPLFWRVLFVPGDPKPLYLRVGSHEEGDFSAALLLAGRQPGKP